MQKNRKTITGNWKLEIGNCKAGFSLIEVMFAMVFLTVIVFGVVKLQTSNLGMSSSQNHELKAHFIVSQGLAIVEGVGIAGIAGCTTSCTKYINDTYLLSDNAADAAAIEAPFSRKIELEEIANGYKATAVVEWDDSTGSHTAKAKRIIY